MSLSSEAQYLIGLIERNDLIGFRQALDKYPADSVSSDIPVALMVALSLRKVLFLQELVTRYPGLRIDLYPAIACFLLPHISSQPELRTFLRLTPYEAMTVLSHTIEHRGDYDQQLAWMIGQVDWSGQKIPDDILIPLIHTKQYPQTITEIFKRRISARSLSNLLQQALQQEASEFIQSLYQTMYNSPYRILILKVLKESLRQMKLSANMFKLVYELLKLDQDSTMQQELLLLARKAKRSDIVRLLQGSKQNSPTAYSDGDKPSTIDRDLLQRWPQSIISKYTIITEIGRGAFGVVYLAQDKNTAQQVAIKRSIKRYSDNDLQEQLQLEHNLPNEQYFIKTFSIIRDRYGYLYQIMEYVPWPDLFTMLQTMVTQGRSISNYPCVVLNILRQLSQAVQILHNNNMAHRDIKLENILISPDLKQIKLIDFGLSCTLKRLVLRKCNTRSGTPYYLPPFLLHSNIGDILYDIQLAKAQDIWAVGVVAYVMTYYIYPYDPPMSRQVYRAMPLLPQDSPLAKILHPLFEMIFKVRRADKMPSAGQIHAIIKDLYNHHCTK